MKIKVTLLDDDERYLSKITSALTSKYPDKVEMHSFTDKEAALQSLSKDRIDVFVAADFFDIQPDAVPGKCAFAYFTDSDDVEFIAGCKTISRYQKVDEIFNRIQKVYLEKKDVIVRADFDQDITKVVNFISPAGGTGCSVAAVSFAFRCAKAGKKVLYLNLDCFADADVFFDGEGDKTIGNMIYYLKSKKVNLSLKHDDIVKKDSSGVEYYSSAGTALDMKELSNQEILELLGQIKTWGNYDYIVLDGYFELTSDYVQFLNTCNLVVLVTDGSEISNGKTQRAVDAMRIIEQQAEVNVISKFALLYNRFSTRTSHKIDMDNINEIGGIKRYEGYTSVEHLITEIVRETKAFDTIL